MSGFLHESSDMFSITALAEKLNENQLVVRDMSSKDTILLMGTTNAGKTTTLCYLAGKKLKLRVEEMVDDDGVTLLFGEEVLDTVEEVEEYKIGHSTDSTTKSIFTCSAPGGDYVITDSCGFGDSEGILVDITNAISLRNGMMSCSSVRPVFVIDVRNLTTDKAASFTKLLDLIERFFTPVDKYLDNMSFCFTHCAPNDTEEKIKYYLTKLDRSTQIQSRPVRKQIVSRILKFLQTYGSRTILYSSDMTRDDAQNKSLLALQMILDAPPIRSFIELGHPLSSDAIISLCDKCKECLFSIMSSLKKHLYREAFVNLEVLKVLHECTGLDQVSEQFSSALQMVQEAVGSLVGDAQKALRSKCYDQFSSLLQYLSQAKCLQDYRDVLSEYNTLLVELDTKFKLLCQDVLYRQSNDIEIVSIMDELGNIDKMLSDFIVPRTKDVYCKTRTSLIERANQNVSKCQVFNEEFRNVMDHDGPTWELESILSEGKHTHSRKEVDDRRGLLQSIPHFFEELASMSVLKQIVIFEDFGPPLSYQYNTVLQTFTSLLGYVRSILMGLLADLAKGDFSVNHSSQLMFYFDVTRSLIRSGLYDHVQEDESVLIPDDSLLSTAKDSLIAHTHTIQSNLIRYEFQTIRGPLYTLQVVHLNDTEFTEFQTKIAKHEVELVTEMIQGLHRDAMKAAAALAVSEVTEVYDYDNPLRSLQYLQDATCLDVVLTSSSKDFVSELVAEVTAAFHSDWKNRFKGVVSLVNDADNATLLTQKFQRLDSMSRLVTFLPIIAEDVRELVEFLSVNIQTAIESPRGPDSDPVKLVADIKGLLKWIAFLPPLDSSTLIPRENVSNLMLYAITLEATKSDFILKTCKRVRDAKDRAHRSFLDRDCVAVNDALNELNSYVILDEYIEPKSATIYAQLKSTLRGEIQSMKYAAEVALTNGELDEASRLRSFFEDSNAFAHHFADMEDLDFHSTAKDLLNKHRMSSERIPEEVSVIISRDGDRFDLIREKLQSVIKRDDIEHWDPRDKSIFDKCDRAISFHFRQLEHQLCDCDSRSDEDAITLLIRLLRSATEAMLLKGIVKLYQPTELLQQVVDVSLRLYSNVSNGVLKNMVRFKFEAASYGFNIMLKFNKMNYVLSYRADLNCFECDLDFKTRNSLFLEQNIIPLDEILVSKCKEYLSGNSTCGSSLASSVSFSGNTNLDNLSNLIQSVDAADRSEVSLFSNKVDFHEIKGAIMALAFDYTLNLHEAFKQSMHDGALEDAQGLHRKMNVLKHMTIQFMKPSMSSIILEQFESQSKDLSSLKDSHASRRFTLSVGTAKAYADELGKLKRDSHALFAENLRKTIDDVKEEMKHFLSTTQSASNPLQVFLTVTALWEFEQFIGFPQGDSMCQRLSMQCEEKFEIYISEKYFSCEESFGQRRNIQTIVTTASSLRSCSSAMMDLVKDSSKGVKWSKLLETVVKKCDNLLEKSDPLLNEIKSCGDVFGAYNIFSTQNVKEIIEKLDLLDKQDSSGRKLLIDGGLSGPGAEAIFSVISDQIDGAVSQVRICLDTEDYPKLAVGFHNIRMLEKSSRLRIGCEKCGTEIERIIESYAADILQAFARAFRAENVGEVEKVVSKANDFDKAFAEHCSQFHIHIMEKITADFDGVIGSMLARVNPQSTVIEDHALLIFQIKTFVSQISSISIQELAFKRIGTYLEELSRSKVVDLFALGAALTELGALGIEVTETYSQFRSVVTKRFNQTTAHITIDHALTELLQKNPSITSAQIDLLKQMYSYYESAYEGHLKSYLAGYGSSFSAQPVSSLISSLQHRTFNTNKAIVEALAGIFAYLTILKSQDMFRDTNNDRECLIKPHIVQLLAIFRLLGVDSVEGFLTKVNSFLGSANRRSFDGHLAQVGTGEGKSILLGGLSCLLALMGYEVYCASYSEYLSRRDYLFFEDLFQFIGVGDQVKYSTLSELMEKVINSDGNVRTMSSSYVFLNNNSTDGPAEASTMKMKPRKGSSAPKKRLLLIDEVDVFFSDNFFGATYEPVSTYSCDETVAIFTHIWINRSNRPTLNDIQQLPQYAALLGKCQMSAKPIIDQQIRFMLEDVHAFGTPAYVVVNTADGKKIGYKVLDTVSTNTPYRYRTAFAYLHEAARYSDIRDKIAANLCLQIPCGVFSYAEVPMQTFDCIMGVTGTLDCLSNVEKEIITNDYRISQLTITPSMYGNSKLSHKKDTGVVLEEDMSRYHQTLTKDIQDERVKGRPVLVFFDTEVELQAFLSSEYGARLNDVNIVTEKTDNVDFFVTKATTAGVVTLFPKVFGRGLDFRVRDKAVDDVGGVHVIQTFFSDYASEEIQIKGRTARQAKNGSYKLILLLQNLTSLGFSSEQLSKLYESGGFYDHLSKKRDENISDKIKVLKDKAVNVKGSHAKSMDFLTLLNDGSATTQAVVKCMMSFGGSGTGLNPTRIIFCLDESGSMTSYWAGLLHAVSTFLQIRIDKGATADTISVIQFGSTARRTMSAAPLEKALQVCGQLKFGNGSTFYVPALELAETEIASLSASSASEFIVVFMTDGECMDNVDAVNATTIKLAQACGTNTMQFFGVAFKEMLAVPTLQSMVESVNGVLVSASTVQELASQFQYIAKEATAKQARG